MTELASIRTICLCCKLPYAVLMLMLLLRGPTLSLWHGQQLLIRGLVRAVAATVAAHIVVLIVRHCVCPDATSVLVSDDN